MLQTSSKFNHTHSLGHLLTYKSTNSHHHNQEFDQQIQIQSHEQDGSSLTIESNVTTTLDTGKSFTIAAILGLQKNAIDKNNHNEYSDVINFSLNSHHKKKTIISNSNYNSNKYHHHQTKNFLCDNVNTNALDKYFADNRIDTNCNQTRSAFMETPVHNFNGTSALQSLQQLHKHHVQQATLSFQVREKVKSDHFSQQKKSLKNKRVRTIFTPEQLERLEAEFERQQYMVGPERLYLAHTLQLTEAQVKVWFQNRRIKWRKHHLEMTQQRLALIRQTGQNTEDSSKLINNQLHNSESIDSIDDRESITELEEP